MRIVFFSVSFTVSLFISPEKKEILPVRLITVAHDTWATIFTYLRDKQTFFFLNFFRVWALLSGVFSPKPLHHHLFKSFVDCTKPTPKFLKIFALTGTSGSKDLKKFLYSKTFASYKTTDKLKSN